MRPASLFSKYSNPAFAALLMTAVVSTPLSAEIIRETERFERKRVSAGEEVTRTVTCPRGHTLTGGGYALYNLPDDRIEFMVTASYPLDEGWRVELRNISDSAQPLAFRIYALCMQ